MALGPRPQTAIRTATDSIPTDLCTSCASGPQGVRVSRDGTSATTDKTPVTIRNFSESEIRTAIVGKTFQYTRDDGNGFVTSGNG